MKSQAPLPPLYSESLRSSAGSGIRREALGHAVYLGKENAWSADEIVSTAQAFADFLEGPRVAATGEEVRL